MAVSSERRDLRAPGRGSHFPTDIESSAGRRGRVGALKPSWRAYWYVVAITALVAGLGAAGLAAIQQPAEWEAAVDVRVGKIEVFGDLFVDPAYVERVLLTTQSITRVAEKEVAEAIPGASLAVEANRNTELLTYTASHQDQGQAQEALEIGMASARMIVERVYGDSLSFTVVGEPGSRLAESPVVAYGFIGLFCGIVAGLAIAWLLTIRSEY